MGKGEGLGNQDRTKVCVQDESWGKGFREKTGVRRGRVEGLRPVTPPPPGKKACSKTYQWEGRAGKLWRTEEGEL